MPYELGVLIVLDAFYSDRTGATSVEYALIASLVSIAIIGALLLFQSDMTGMFQYISNQIDPVLGHQG